MSLYGSSQFEEQPGRKSGFRAGRGNYSERRFEGPTSGADAFIAFTLPGGWIEWEKETDGELTVVSALYQTGEPGSNADQGLIAREWELEGNDLEKSIWEHPDLVASFNNSTTKANLEIRRLIEQVVSGEVEFKEPPANSQNPYDLLTDRLIRGVEAFTVSQYVLRKTERVLKDTSLRPSHSNTNRQFDYVRLLSAEPTLAADNKVAAAELQHIKWLKRTPKTRTVSGGLWEITLEYWGADEWDSWLYKLPT